MSRSANRSHLPQRGNRFSRALGRLLLRGFG
jgi:hypothetical protein